MTERPDDLQALVERAVRRDAASIGEEFPLDKTGCPNLQALVARHGGYDKITESWADYDRAMAEWQERRRDRSGAPSSDRADPERLCICGLAGDYWRPRKDGG